MRRTMLAAAAFGLMGVYGSAEAQYFAYDGPSVGVTVYSDGPRYGYYGYRPRGYGYTYYYSDDPDYVVSYPRYRGGCGEFRYWNGYRCVDKRERRDLP
jgi:hypothetical protein